MFSRQNKYDKSNVVNPLLRKFLTKSFKRYMDKTFYKKVKKDNSHIMEISDFRKHIPSNITLFDDNIKIIDETKLITNNNAHVYLHWYAKRDLEENKLQHIYNFLKKENVETFFNKTDITERLLFVCKFFIYCFNVNYWDYDLINILFKYISSDSSLKTTTTNLEIKSLFDKIQHIDVKRTAVTDFDYHMDYYIQYAVLYILDTDKVDEKKFFKYTSSDKFKNILENHFITFIKKLCFILYPVLPMIITCKNLNSLENIKGNSLLEFFESIENNFESISCYPSKNITALRSSIHGGSHVSNRHSFSYKFASFFLNNSKADINFHPDTGFSKSPIDVKSIIPYLHTNLRKKDLIHLVMNCNLSLDDVLTSKYSNHIELQEHLTKQSVIGKNKSSQNFSKSFAKNFIRIIERDYLSYETGIKRINEIAKYMLIQYNNNVIPKSSIKWINKDMTQSIVLKKNKNSKKTYSKKMIPI